MGKLPILVLFARHKIFISLLILLIKYSMHFLLDDTLAEDLIHSGVYFSAVRNNELSLREESVL